MLRAVNAVRRTLKPVLPHFARRWLRVAWYQAVLPPVRVVSRLREMAGADYSKAPPAHVLAQYGTDDAEQWQRIGEKKYAMIRAHVDELDLQVPSKARILDFGCGACGTLSAFHRHFPSTQVFGCDLKSDVVSWVKKYRPELTVERTAPAPPLPEQFAKFDLIYAISVWTHMPEKACEEWLRHVHERLKPGGVLFFTIAEPSTKVASNHGFDPAKLAKQVAAKGGCLYDAGTDVSFIQKGWVERQVEGRFELKYFGPAKGHNQWVVVLQRLRRSKRKS